MDENKKNSNNLETDYIFHVSIIRSKQNLQIKKHIIPKEH